MASLIKLFFDISLFRAGPQDVPASIHFTAIVIIAYLIFSCVVNSIIYSIYVGVPQAMAELVFLFIFTKAVLLKKPERFHQTITSLVGVSLVLTIIALPISVNIDFSPEGTNVNSIFTLFYLVLLIWMIAAYAHVFRHALSTTLAHGALVSFSYVLISVIISSFITNINNT